MEWKALHIQIDSLEAVDTEFDSEDKKEVRRKPSSPVEVNDTYHWFPLSYPVEILQFHPGSRVSTRQWS